MHGRYGYHRCCLHSCAGCVHLWRLPRRILRSVAHPPELKQDRQTGKCRCGSPGRMFMPSSIFHQRRLRAHSNDLARLAAAVAASSAAAPDPRPVWVLCWLCCRSMSTIWRAWGCLLLCGSSQCQHRSSADTLSAGEHTGLKLVPGSTFVLHAEPPNLLHRTVTCSGPYLMAYLINF